MHLSISKRFEFSSSHRLFVKGWTDEQNVRFYGPESGGPHGHGHNYAAYFVFNGPVDEKTGMMINVVTIKDIVKAIIDGRYDHKYLNTDTPPFDDIVPTAENVSRRLLDEAAALFHNRTAQPVACHLTESPSSEATAYSGGKVERHLWTDFSAARRTGSPHLSDEENERLFGQAASASGHGHHYRLRVTLKGEPGKDHGVIFPEAEAARILGELHKRFDHHNLSVDFPELRDMPMTTETLSDYFFDYLKGKLPVRRLKLYENDRFFTESLADGRTLMGIVADFHAAHRLHSPSLSNGDNQTTYGKCNNPQGHGHLYRVECTIDGEVDPTSGSLYGLDKLNNTLASVLSEWNYKHLDFDTSDFDKQPSTGENIVRVMWSKVSNTLGEKLYRLRLWETQNNRFTLRRELRD
jgi:6-pyruvoyltetrahydropterin/6-carboxytetrahydropterin synthase